MFDPVSEKRYYDMFMNSYENKKYAKKNEMGLHEFLRKTGKDLPEVDDEGAMIVNRDDYKKNRWLED